MRQPPKMKSCCLKIISTTFHQALFCPIKFAEVLKCGKLLPQFLCILVANDTGNNWYYYYSVISWS